MTSITRELIRCGIIQFGLFNDAPIRLNFKLLVSYPALLATMAERLGSLIDYADTDKLLCGVDTVALGALISHKTHIPLVYAQERYNSAAQDLVGAYDVGHPTVFICNIWDSTSKQIISKAEQGGLRITHVVSIVQMPLADDLEYHVHSVWTLAELVEVFRAENALNENQARLIMDWSESCA